MVLLFCGNAIADSNERDVKLDHLFEQLKKINNKTINIFFIKFSFSLLIVSFEIKFL